jgi:hypothetical protein
MSENSLVHRLILGVVESAANQVVTQFDMPQDDAQIVKTCRLEWGKNRRWY